LKQPIIVLATDVWQLLFELLKYPRKWGPGKSIIEFHFHNQHSVESVENTIIIFSPIQTFDNQSLSTKNVHNFSKEKMMDQWQG
jgi:hypothetical protein